MKQIYSRAGSFGNILGLRCSTVWLALFLLLSFSSCTITRDKCNQLYPPIVMHSSDTVIQVTETIIHDTTFIAADESSIEITFEADSQNNVQVTSVTNKAGKRSNIDFRTERNNKLLHAMFDCNCDSFNIYHTFKDRDTSSAITHNNTAITIVEKEKELKGGQKFTLLVGPWCIGILSLQLILILLYLGYKIAKIATPQGAAITGIQTGLSWFGKLFKRGSS